MTILITKTSAVGSQEITDDLFGGNLIFDRDNLDGAFSEAASNLGVTSLRYPGGGVSEKRDMDSGEFLFDVTDPDATSIQRLTTDENGNEVWYDHPIIAVSDFISHASENGMDMTFVIPTSETYGQNYKMVFGDPDFQAPTKDGEEVPLLGLQWERVNAIVQYARDLIDGKYGDISGAVLEIGNEFYADMDNPSSNEPVEYPYAYVTHTAATYGEVSSYLSKEISDYATSVGKRDQIEIHVQAGITEQGGEKDKSSQRNSTVLNEFDADELDAIDGVTAHFYPWDKDALVEEDPDGSKDHNDDRAQYVDAWSIAAGRDLDLNVSEWNVGSPNGVDGLLQVAAISEFFEFFQRNGVDKASVWPIMQNTQNDLSGNSEGEDLSLAGEFFQMAARSLVGKTLYESSNVSADIKSYYYMDSAGNITLVLVNNSASGLSETLDLTGLAQNGEAVAVSTLKAYNSGTDVAAYMDSKAEAHLSVTNYDASVGSIPLDFMQHGVIVVNIAKTEGLNIQADLQIGDYSAETGAEAFTGTQFADAINMGAGDDTLDGAAGDDTLVGGDGDDTITGGDGQDILQGGSGHDTLVGETGDDVLSGEGGNDRLYGETGADILDGGDAADTLDGGIGNDTLIGGAGDDTMLGEGGQDYMEGGSGLDTIRGGDDEDTIYGDDGDDKLMGDNGNDWLYGGTGDDSLRGGAQDDWIEGGAGMDTVRGDGDDDTVFGGGDDDNIRGNAGNDSLMGDDGDDWIEGGLGNDVLEGGLGYDSLRGDEDNDTISGGDGEDQLRGGSGDDVISGDDGDDGLYGEDGFDLLMGGAGNDRLLGENGEDTLSGGAGEDRLFGGDGADTFVFTAASGSNIVMDYQAGLDIVDAQSFGLTQMEMENAITQDGTTVIFAVEDSEMEFRNALEADIEAAVLI